MTKRLVAHILWPHDNDGYMLGEHTRKADAREARYFDWRFVAADGGPHPATCPRCGSKTDPDYIDPAFRLKSTRRDLSHTYDGYTIASDAFKRFVEARADDVPGVRFTPLPAQPGFHRLVLTRMLEVDTERSTGLRRILPCDLCRTHAGVFGPDGVRLKGVDSPLPDGLYRTDLEFGQAHERAPLLLVGTRLAAAIKAEKFKGIAWGRLDLVDG